ncbi:unnamed protein product, partial [Iphiclides podalirius]
MVDKIPTLQLSSGFQIPVIGFGTYARKTEVGTCQQAVEWALDAGYRHIDTASCYGNEQEIGEAIENKIGQGTVKREDLFITTKLWNDKHAEKDVIPALKESLERLKLDYVDLYLIHWPVSISATGQDEGIDYTETWRGMEKAVELGLARSIGVSNFNEQQLGRLLEYAEIKPAVNQFEINPTFTAVDWVNYCKEKSVLPVAYTPLGLISEARPEFKGKDVIKTDPKLGEIAKKYGKSRAQIALRYLIQRGIPVLPKSFTKSRIEENLKLFDFELEDKEMDVVAGYNINHRCIPGLIYKNCKNFPF